MVAPKLLDPESIPMYMRGKNFYKLYGLEDPNKKDKEKKKKDKKKNKQKDDKLKVVVDNSIKSNNKSNVIDKEAYNKKLAEITKERKEQEERDKRNAENRIIELVAKRDLLIGKLNKLNPYKKKDAAKIAEINIEINDIDNTIKKLKSDYNIKNDRIDKSNPVKRFFNKIKSGISKTCKRVGRFFKRNGDNIIKIAAVSLPLVAAIILKVA